MSDEETIHVVVELGKIARHVEVPELAIRQIDAGPDAYDDPEEAAPPEYRLQGRIVNNTSAKLSSVKYDVAYFDARDGFLGLDRCGFLDDDELDTDDDFLAIDMELTIPPEATRCVFNCRALKAGFFSRFFWG